MEINPFNEKHFMNEALKEAQQALESDEVPVGCVIVCGVLTKLQLLSSVTVIV